MSARGVVAIKLDSLDFMPYPFGFIVWRVEIDGSIPGRYQGDDMSDLAASAWAVVLISGWILVIYFTCIRNRVIK